MLPNRTFMAIEHSCFQSFTCQHFGQVQAIVLSAVALKLYVVSQDCVGKETLMVSSPKITSSPIETATIRKLRIRLLLPFLLVLYLAAFIDRINLGFAAVTMNRELGIGSQQFGFAAGIFFCGYFLFEVPSNFILHKVGARVWIARILITWGAVATLTGFVQIGPSALYRSLCTRPRRSGILPRYCSVSGLLVSAAGKGTGDRVDHHGHPVASVWARPISGFILDHVDWFGLSSWRWLFILEGLPAMACVSVTYFLLPKRTGGGKLSHSERKGMDRRPNWSRKSGRSPGRDLILCRER